MSSGRDRDLTQALALWGKSADLKQKVADSRVLVVGAGGIGCELLKILVLSGFKKIEIVDLDTIDVSNLNRQFLFRREHVGQSKAAVAAKAVLRFNSDVDVTARHGNIKDKQFGFSFMQQFDVVFNALDNVEARRHVNRICMAAERPLVDGGTSGYLGQVVTMFKGKTACYDCTPKPAPKGFAVCTIRSTPEKPIHCVVWAKHLFSLLFGVKDDENAVTEVDCSMDAAQVVRKLFVDDIKSLAAKEDVWKTRKPPSPVDLDGSLAASLTSEGLARSSLEDRTVWGLGVQVQVLISRYRELVQRAQTGSLTWDKDDDAAMDFVLCASNLRASNFGIEMQTSFDCKKMAGNIIAAIATTNAIISGYMVLEAFKIIDQRIKDCKFTYKCKSEPTGKKVKKLLIVSDPDAPNPQCPVCSGGGTANLTINTHKTTFDWLLKRVLKQDLGLNEPILDTDGGNTIECLGTFEDPVEERTFAQLMTQKLSHPSVGLMDGTLVEVLDESQGDFKMKLKITHSDDMDPESDKIYELHRGSTAPTVPAAGGTSSASNGSAPVIEDDDDVCVLIEESDATDQASGKRKRDNTKDSSPKKKHK